MGNLLLPDFVLGDIYFGSVSNFTYVVYVFLSLIFSTAFVFLCLTLYKKIRKNFPLKVNCWFCNNNTTIPYHLYNGWDCPHCQQYNGFSKDGDYNKIIPEQYNSKLNKDIVHTLKTPTECRKSSQTNGLCKLCNINQQLKIQQLALFVPINEQCYYEEIEQYREKLEKAYKLCTKCERVLQETLEKQEYNLLQSRLNSFKGSTLPQQTKVLTMIGKNNILNFIKKNGMPRLKEIHIILGVLLFLSLLIHFESENQFLRFSLPSSTLEPFLPFVEVLLQCQSKIYTFKKELSFIGLLFSLLVQLENKFRKNNVILLSWALLHIVLWSSLNELQVIVSGLCFFLSIQALQKKSMESNKKSRSTKFGNQVLEGSNFKNYSRHNNKVPSPVLKSDNFTSGEENTDFSNVRIKETEEKIFGEEKKKKSKQKENEIESLSNEEKEKLESPLLNSPSNSSFIKKSFSPTAETSINNSENNWPLNEVFNTLNSLQLGGKQKKLNKPPNFLFANHNYSEGKNSSSIIKPAKLIKNLNSSSWTESNEGNSRSSTPSSGYSTQKPEKIETSRYDFPKTMTPISLTSFNRHSPNNCFDYCDGTHGFYNMNSFSPGLSSLQFPGPLGHTTIYACTRPTNYPFSLSPWHSYPVHKFSPASRFSDASDCDNLFQESTKRFGKQQRLSKMKSFFYNFSIFLNIVTFVSLMCFTSMEIILVDWKLPKFNFFA